MNLKEEEIQIVETLKEKIEKQGIEVQAWAADGKEHITDAVVFIYNKKTKRSELATTLQLCDSFGQEMLGMIEINK